jgi:glycosyltransferase involved in cell wall biosynthesis
MNSKLKIGISARGLGKAFSGPNSYIEGFAGEFIRQAGDYEVHIYYNSPEPLGLFERAVEHVVPASNAFLWDHVLLPRQAEKDRLSLLIFPKGTISFRLQCQAIPIMLDLGYFYDDLNPYKKLDTLYMRRAMKFSAIHSAAILTISEYTRQDVIRLLNAAPEKVVNIYGAASKDYQPVQDANVLNAVRSRYKLIDPFIFFPTSISPRKNFNRLLDAFESVKDKIPHHLYFTGSIAWNTEDVIERLKGPIASRVHQLGKVPLEDMPALYTLAQFTVYPSLFEGLGLPVLEAFQCGSPVLTSNQTSIPEIAGDAALIVDAHSTQAIADGLLRMAADSSLRASLREKGFRQAENFTWEKTVQTALDTISRLVHSEVKAHRVRFMA